jgi:hypothetical protein
LILVKTTSRRVSEKRRAAFVVLALLLAGCEIPNVSVSVPEVRIAPELANAVDVSTTTAVAPRPTASASVAAFASAAPAASGAPSPKGDAFFACRLPAPVRSDDACVVDADCAPLTPCHARACVGRAKAHAAEAATQCSREMACDSVDANRCGCLEGRCSLIPPG